MPKVFIGVGSNLGEREAYLEFAKKELSRSEGLTALRCSQVYETEPVWAGGGPFLNAVWSLETDLSPRELLERMQGLEAAADRRRNKPNDARTLDLDILFYGEQVIQDPQLTVPHPRLHERAFVLVPFCDLAPEWRHPVLKKRMKELLEALTARERGAGSVKLFRSGPQFAVPRKKNETHSGS